LAEEDRVRIGEEPATGRAAQQCLKRYYEELSQRFEAGFDPRKSVLESLDEFSPPNGSFLVIRVDGEPVGCGGLTPLGKAAYLKRMWIAPNVRGRGLAKRLLGALEHKARELGYRFVRLETNRALGEAQRLYRSSGYVEVQPFNAEHYAHHWFEKPLD
jgi:GNAT superfamily N-acetyltransferase